MHQSGSALKNRSTGQKRKSEIKTAIKQLFPARRFDL